MYLSFREEVTNMNVRIFPSSPSTYKLLADFLMKHGFNLGPLTREGFFVTTIGTNYGAIDTLAALKKLAEAPKVNICYEFYFHEEPADDSATKQT